jgi:glycosyltransferase involved in cell wall biosynthesis
MFKKIIFVAGIGKLHFIASAVQFNRVDEVKTLLYSSWVPSDFSMWALRSIGFKGLTARLQDRVAARQKHITVRSFLTPELLYHVALKRIMPHDLALALAFKLFGFFSAFRVLIDADKDTLIHLRSGAGFLFIKLARYRGATILVDHSIAHPLEFSRLVSYIPDRYSMGAGLEGNNTLWRQVLNDCDAADAIVVNSDFVKETFLLQDVSTTKVSVVYLGCDLPSELGARPPRSETLTLAFSGHFDIRKGANILIELMSQVSGLYEDVRLDVYGSISQSGESVMADSACSEVINFVGYLPRDEMLARLRTSDIYIFPSYMEGCAKSVVEAMALGLPVITTKASGAPISHGKDGVIIDDVNDIGAWIKAIDLLRCPVYRKTLGDAAQKKANLKCSPESYVRNLLALYSKIFQH